MCDTKQLKAIATTYDGIVFRSRLEAIIYRYIILSTEDNCEFIEYEPKLYKTKLWTPDFLVGFKKTGTIALVEVKPESYLFNFWKYAPSFDSHEDIGSLCTICPEFAMFLNRDGSINVIKTNEELYKQASNDVYHFINHG